MLLEENAKSRDYAAQLEASIIQLKGRQEGVNSL